MSPTKPTTLTRAQEIEIARAVAGRSQLPYWAQGMVGQSLQLRMPIRDVLDLRRQAAILRELANRLEVLSHDRDPAENVLVQAWFACRKAQGQLKSQTAAPGKKDK